MFDGIVKESFIIRGVEFEENCWFWCLTTTDCLNRNLIRKRPGTANGGRVILQHIVLISCSWKDTSQEKVSEFDWEVLPYLLCSSDSTPSDCHLFLSLEYFLRNKILRLLEQFFVSKNETRNFINREYLLFHITLIPKKRNTFLVLTTFCFSLCILNFDTFKVKLFQENEKHTPPTSKWNSPLFQLPWLIPRDVEISQSVGDRYSLASKQVCNWFSIEAITLVSLCSRFLAAGFVGNPESLAARILVCTRTGSRDTKSSQV